MRVPHAWSVGAAVILLIAPTLALPPPVLPGTPQNPGAYATPHEVAFATLSGLRSPDGLYTRVPSTSFEHSADQFLAVLALVERARAFSRLAASLEQDALSTWAATEPAWDPTNRVYHVTLARDTRCVHLETNAWALLASEALGNATGNAEVSRRAGDLARTLIEVVAPTGGRTREACTLGAAQWPLAAWALLQYGSAARDATAAGAAMARLQEQLDQLYDVAVRDPQGIYIALTNVQYLLALQSAVSRDPSFAPYRAELSRFVQQRLLSTVDGHLVVRSVEPRGDAYVPVETLYPVDQVWAAYALEQERRATSLLVDEAPERLLAGLIDRYWSGARGASTLTSDVADLALNALAAVFTRSAAPTSVTLDDPLVTIVVPAARGFDYPSSPPSAAAAFHVFNQWSARFHLEAPHPGQQRVLLAPRSVGPVAFEHPASLHSPLRLTRAGQSQPIVLEVDAARPALLSFVAEPPTQADYRLTAYAPVYATQSNVDRAVTLGLANHAQDPLSLAELRLELALVDIEITQVRVNERVLLPSEYDANAVERTTALPQRHVGLEIRDVVLRPGAANEVFVAYDDDLAPTLGELRVTRDAAGLEPVRTREENKQDVQRLDSRGHGYVWVTARDNAMLKRVYLEIETQNLTTINMFPVTGQPGMFVAEIPPDVLPEDLAVAFSVLAVDEWDNLAEAQEGYLKAETSFFREGDPILFVFSATLFASAAVIYFRMGRRRQNG